MNLIKLTDLNPSLETWIDFDEIAVMQRNDPKKIKSTLLIPGQDKDIVTVVVTKTGRTINVVESPEQIIAIATGNLYPPAAPELLTEEEASSHKDLDAEFYTSGDLEYPPETALHNVVELLKNKE